MIEVQKLIRNWSINSAKIIITPSDHLKGFVSELGFKKEILKINNGVEITEIQRKTLDKPEINLIIVSRLVIQKNIDLVINALKILNNVESKT